ncbi:hypothetical protein [Sphingomonas jaspsi]|uniref:hypothetical protein n=1 Tax=Sphingomonas jaspsi TaxID=392409 RepID=UPI0004AF2BBB|nr:hypothetical protein [Sphingomonas jaspsi]
MTDHVRQLNDDTETVIDLARTISTREYRGLPRAFCSSELPEPAAHLVEEAIAHLHLAHNLLARASLETRNA